MKTSRTFILSLCLLLIGNICVSADNNDTTVDNAIINGKNKDKKNDKSVDIVPFYAYHQNGILYIGTTGEFSSIDVCVTNTITNNVWNSILFFTNGIATLDISDGCFGNYMLEIETEYGDEFVGYFTLY